VTASIPNDYRQRQSHRNSGSRPLDRHFRRSCAWRLSASQRADVMGLARTWVREGTGAMWPMFRSNTPNARAAADSFREVQACLRQRVPPRGITLRRYHPDDPRTFRNHQAKLSKNGGGCRTVRSVARGSRTLDREPRLRLKTSRTTILVCATQRNLAAIDRQSVGPRSSRDLRPPPIRRGAPLRREYRKGDTTTNSLSRGR